MVYICIKVYAFTSAFSFKYFLCTQKIIGGSQLEFESRKAGDSGDGGRGTVSQFPDQDPSLFSAART